MLDCEKNQLRKRNGGVELQFFRVIKKCSYLTIWVGLNQHKMKLYHVLQTQNFGSKSLNVKTE